MTKRISILIALFTVTFFSGCSVHKRVVDLRNDKALVHFASLLTGKFSSKKQAAEDSTYLRISLIMTPIWQDRTDGIWLYVEQAAASRLTKPYRQRVYKLTRPGANIFQSDIYTIQNALDFAGLQDDVAKMQKLTPDKIELKDGCAVIMSRKNNLYEGGTQGESCPSDLRGASYATTKITLTDGQLYSWDQGFDSSDIQVWGAIKGGYVFLKEK